ncbi:MAG: 2Fe-2S iron-sulfur cluster binding domain-containing protein [Arenimonas sp.]|uniref:flavin reductase family protein n=1 Tax=Arenimonas sp. TaxID=1872635 RepID=UPI0025B8E4BA|nr:2Fe-2S iron-sulfur cluster-binding protein [Arenimonas sp.]MBW8368046.1 2Fe-2S iron-sulfur cluster binding domain-containing protein [Arenimonas sp.]
MLRSPLLAPLNQPEAWSRLAGAVNPVWSLVESRARVVRVVDEAPGVLSLWLKPNRRFGRFQPGQHALLELDINGARHGRCFSFSSAPRADGLVRITIKRKHNGPVSGAAHALQPGQVVRLGRAQGAFAPRTGHQPLLLLAAGSGMTPMMSLLEAMADAGSTRDVVLLQSSSTAGDLLFAQALDDLAARLPGLRRHAHVSGDSGRLDPEAIEALVPDWSTRETLLCGPDGFMAVVESMHARAGLTGQLTSESFGRRAAPVVPGADFHAVSLSGADFTVASGQSLLEGAEKAGLSPRFGCRRGICRSCQCRKLSGTVLNQLTGQVSGPGEELIQLCISTPQSALELAP